MFVKVEYGNRQAEKIEIQGPRKAKDQRRKFLAGSTPPWQVIPLPSTNCLNFKLNVNVIVNVNGYFFPLAPIHFPSAPAGGRSQ